MKLSGIRIYPVKSLAGILLNESPVEMQGLKNDRMLMLVNEEGMFITQRKYPQLALIFTQLRNQILHVNAPMFSELKLDDSCFTKQKINVRVWKDECNALVANQQINQWFSKYLRISVKLVKYSVDNPRQSDQLYSKESDIVSFADGFPLLALSESSLDDLNSRLVTPVTMTHFRPNIIVSHCDAYAEDHWNKIQIGEVVFDAVKRCGRCILTTIDPNTGIKNPAREPLQTLAEYRKGTSDIYFGMNLIPRNRGVIRINDLVTVLD